MKYTREQLDDLPIGQPARDEHGTIWVKTAERQFTSYGEPKHRYNELTTMLDLDLTLIELTAESGQSQSE